MHITALFAGAFLCNAVPHVVAGLRGEHFPTPFARFADRRTSPPLVNLYWGLLNILAGWALAIWQPITVGADADSAVFVVGAAVMGTFLAIRFDAAGRGEKPI